MTKHAFSRRHPDAPFGFPIKTARWRIAILRRLFPKRDFIQIGKSIYWLREL